MLQDPETLKPLRTGLRARFLIVFCLFNICCASVTCMCQAPPRPGHSRPLGTGSWNASGGKASKLFLMTLSVRAMSARVHSAEETTQLF